MKRAKLEIEAMYYADIPKYLPEEWNLMRDVWQKIDEAERERDREAALRWYSYVLQKSELLEDMVAEKKKEQEMIKRKREEEKKKQAELEKEKAAAKAETIKEEIKEPEKAQTAAATPKKKTIEDVRYRIEKRFPSFYTVKEESSLEEVSALPNIYNDRYYWPLIYKFNRNQVRDPNKLYRGQILKIPRNITLEEIYRAREEAKAKLPRVLPKTAYTPEKYKRFIEELLSED
ncbi:MAG: DUF4398 domain-containing protein [bacterium]